MFGLWKVTSLSDGDSAGAERIADVVSCMNGNIEGTVYLPPYLRPNQCGIAAGSVVVGYVDDVTGKGAAFCGIDEADYGYFMNADVQFRQNMSVVGNAAIGGDASIGGGVTASGDATVTGNVSAADCRVMMAAVQIPNPEWVDDGHGTDPDAHGQARYITQPACVSSLAAHTHTCAAPGSPTTPPIPTPIPGA